MPTVSYGIANTADDAYSAPALGLNGNDGAVLGDTSGFKVWAAWRFQGVLAGVDAGATITAASLVLKENPSGPVLGGGGSGTNLGRIYATTEADSSAFTPTGIPSLSKGTAFTTATYGGATTTLDVLALVQEWKGRAGWAPGNDLTLVGDPTTSTANHIREFFDYVASTTNCAQLSITYTAGGPTAYTLTADKGTFTLTGQAANLKRGRRAAADVRAVALTGQAAGLIRGRSIAGNAATYSLGGQPAGLRATRAIRGDAGAFALSGQAATLRATRTMAAAVGTYVLTGQAAAFDIGKKLAAAAGAFTWTGRAAGLVYFRRLKADAGAFVLTGQAVTMTSRRAVMAEAGAFSLTGQSAGLLYSRRMTAEAGAFVLTGMAADLVADTSGSTILTAEAGTFLMTGGGATFRITGWRPVPPTGETWTPVAGSPETWTPVSRNPTSWT